jgi:ATP-binding cassette subfamily F protein 3
MVEFKKVAIKFNGHYLFENVSFTINFGEKVALVGRNGTGKSTLIKMITGQITPDEGSVEISDYYKIGFLQQNLAFEKNTAREEVCSVLPIDRLHEEWKADKILDGLGFSEELKQKDPNLLSGGYQVKTQLAKLLISEPDLLVLDEPTNYLDITSIIWLENFLTNWETELLVVSHNQHFVDNVTNTTVLIHRGTVLKANNTALNMKKQIAAEETNYETKRLAQEKERKLKLEWVAKWGANKGAEAKKILNQLDKEVILEKLEHIPDLNFKFNYSEVLGSDTMIQVKNLCFGYDESNLLIKDLSFHLKNGDKLAIIGANGNGKSTLLKLIASELKPLGGTIEVSQKVKSGYFGQTNIDRLDKTLSVYDEIHSANSKAPMQTVRMICSKMLFSGDSAFKNIAELSGGEKSRVMLGKIISNSTNTLLLDEPTNHLDFDSGLALKQAIKDYEGCVIMVTHDESFLYEIPDKLIIFDDNETYFFDGKYEEFLKKIGFKNTKK